MTIHRLLICTSASIWVVACSDPDDDAPENMSFELRERNRQIADLENERDELKKRPDRLSKDQMDEIRERLDKLRAIKEETVELSNDTEDMHAAIDHILAEHTKELQIALEGYDSAKEIFQGDSLNLGPLPALIQQMKDDLEAAEKEKAHLQNMISDLHKNQK